MSDEQSLPFLTHWTAFPRALLWWVDWAEKRRYYALLAHFKRLGEELCFLSHIHYELYHCNSSEANLGFVSLTHSIGEQCLTTLDTALEYTWLMTYRRIWDRNYSHFTKWIVDSIGSTVSTLIRQLIGLWIEIWFWSEINEIIDTLIAIALKKLRPQRPLVWDQELIAYQTIANHNNCWGLVSKRVVCDPREHKHNIQTNRLLIRYN